MAETHQGELLYGTTGKLGKYLKVHGDDPAEAFWDVAMSTWELKKPKMIISVVGSGASLKLSPVIREKFGRGLINAILSSNAWVLTCGTNVGIAKEVGNAISKYAMGCTDDINLIGFVGWNMLSEFNRTGMEQNPHKRHPYTATGDVRALDAHHRFQCFVDHGSLGEHGKEMTYRTRVENFLRNNPGEEVNIFSVQKYQVPTVCVVVQGGWTSLKKAYKAVMEGIPGSGGFSDVIAEALDLKMDQITPAKVIELMEENDLGGKTSDITDIKKWTRWLLSMLQYNIMFDGKLINVFSFSGNADNYIDKAILNAILQLEKSLAMKIHICMAWNRPKKVREILEGTDEIEQLSLKDRRILFRTCILMNRVKFMEILFDFDIVNRSFLNAMRHDPKYGQMLVRFYRETPQSESPAYTLWARHLPGEQVTIANLANFENIVFKMDGYISCYDIDQMTYKGIEPFYPMRDLFFWSLLMGHFQMSFALFSNVDLGLTAALAGVRILKRLAENCDNETFLVQIEEFSNKYELAAKGILDKCYEHSRQDVVRLLLRKVPHFGDVKMIDLAIAAGSRLIKTHPGVQMVTACAWQGSMGSSTSWSHILLGLIFPPILLWDKFITFYYSEDIILSDSESMLLVSVAAELHELQTPSTMMDKTPQPTRATSIQMEKIVSDGDSIMGDEEDTKKLMELGEDHDENAYIEDDVPVHLVETPLFMRFALFYSAPRVIFTTHNISFAIFLTLFARVLLLDFGTTPSWTEWVLFFWVFCFVLEEIRQIFEAPSISKKQGAFVHYIRKGLIEWITDSWNIIDLFGFVTFYIGFFMRYGIKEELEECDAYMIYQNETSNCEEMTVNKNMYWSHGLMCISFVLYCLRLLHIFTMSHNLGPKLVMIRKMMKDIFVLLAILAVFILSYGVVSQALLYPNHNDVLFTFRRMFRRAYFHIYGELFLEEVEFIPDVSELECTYDPQETAENGIPRCPVADSSDHMPLVPIFMATYMIIANVLLLNLLIAMFAKTYDKVEEEAEEVSNYLQYELIMEYFTKPPLPAPLNFISIIHRVISKRVHDEDDESDSKSRSFFNSGSKALLALEKWGTDSYFNEIKTEELSPVRDLVKNLENTVNQNRAQVLDQFELVGASQDAFQFMMEQHFKQMSETMRWMTQAMVQSNITIAEGDFAGPPPNIQIPLNLRQILSNDTKHKNHKMARAPFYVLHGGGKIRRYPVPDARVTWQTAYPSYDPEKYSQPDASSTKIDKLTDEEMTDIRNPIGRTGISGRGRLQAFGENKQLILLVWRWLKDADNENVTTGGQNMIQVLAIRKTRYLQWQLPKVFADDEVDLPAQFRAMFYEQCFGRGSMSEQVRENFNYIFSESNEAYMCPLHEDYIDDHKNTDNAWVHGTCVAFELNFEVDFDSSEEMQNNELLCTLNGSPGGVASWITITDGIKIYEPHLHLIEQLADRECAHFARKLE